MRQRERQALDTGRLAAPRSMSWSGDGGERHLPLVNDVMPHRAKRKGCKRNKGGPHTPVYQHPTLRKILLRDDQGRPYWKTDWTNRGRFPWGGWYCSKCGKHMWSYRPKVDVLNVPNDLNEKPPLHWTYENIVRRIYGDGKCGCGCGWGE